jgi:hypothetical protein
MMRAASLQRVVALLIAVLFLCSGCAQFMASNAPKDLHTDRAFQYDVQRAVVIGTLGAPVTTDSDIEGQLSDVYKYTDGRTANAWAGKSLRILAYTVGDLFTLFLSQVIWMPLELAISGKEYTASVDFTRRLEDEKWVVRAWTETDMKGRTTKSSEMQ